MLRAALRKRDGDKCHLCGQRMFFGGKVHPDNELFATIDHLTPRSLGGSHGIENLALAHRRCNLARGNAPIAPQPAAKDVAEALP